MTDHNAMIIALQKFGLSRKSLEVIRSIYTDPTFFTKGPEDHTVGAGIRQGCPLSPYLIVVKTEIMEDVDCDLRTQGIARNIWSIGHRIRGRYTFDGQDQSAAN